MFIEDGDTTYRIVGLRRWRSEDQRRRSGLEGVEADQLRPFQMVTSSRHDDLGLGYVLDIFFMDETEECFRLLIGRHTSTVATGHVGGTPERRRQRKQPSREL